jgi:putative protein-disulfide isomerase
MKDGKIEITYYTDPLCCWSWAFEPQWRKFAFRYRQFISWRYCLCGLIPDWNNYHDDVNNVSRPAQLGPVWLEAHRASGMPIDTSVWHKSAPSSSFPACIAVKCAFLQSQSLGETFLRRVRESIMTEGKNIATDEILIDIAKQLSVNSLMDLAQFCTDYFGTTGREAFRKDWLEARGLGIKRYPTIVLSRGAEATIVSGYHAFPSLEQALHLVCPGLASGKEPLSAYKNYWGELTEREIQEFESDLYNVGSRSGV